MHEDEGHYAGKHLVGTDLNELAVKAVKKHIRDERISCAAAHEVAAEIGVSPVVIGKTLDLLEVRIMECQLGLFGHGGKDHGKANLSLPENVEALKKAVTEKCDAEGISCYSLWAAAEESGCSKMNAAAICDELDINIHSCQLGTF